MFTRLFAKPIFSHPRAADLLLGGMNMERTLETHSAICVLRCLDGADSQLVEFPGNGRAFQPTFRDVASDSSRAR